MNERIRELAEQAKLRPALLAKHWGTIEALTDSEQKELFGYIITKIQFIPQNQLEHFAELIVRECASMAFDILMEKAGRSYLVHKMYKTEFGA